MKTTVLFFSLVIMVSILAGCSTVSYSLVEPAAKKAEYHGDVPKVGEVICVIMANRHETNGPYEEIAVWCHEAGYDNQYKKMVIHNPDGSPLTEKTYYFVDKIEGRLVFKPIKFL